MLPARRRPARRGAPRAREPLPLPIAAGLPSPVDRLIGRDRFVADLTRALRARTSRLVVLTGPGGVGKTRLALAAAAAVMPIFADGAVFVSLAPVRDPAQVLPAIAQAIDVREQAGQPVGAQLVAVLRDREMLLVLDNFEQVLPAATALAELLGRCPRLVVLATSRTRLKLQGERDWPVPPLKLPPLRGADTAAATVASSIDASAAVQLFVERARAVAPAFALTPETAPVVATITHRLDGLPLAIELAAAKIRLLPAPVLLAQLDRRLLHLADGPADQPARLQTMRRAIAWSYDLLPPPALPVFERLAVFVGGFSADAAATVVGASLSQIGTLVDQSLLVTRAAPSGQRYVMLETIREFADERLHVSGRERTQRDLHASWLLNLARQWEPALVGDGDQVGAMRLFRDEHANLRAALSHLVASGQANAALELMARLGFYWFIGGDLVEARTWYESLLPVTPTAPPAIRVWAWLVLAFVRISQGSFPLATAAIAEGLAILEQHPDPRGMNFAFTCQALAAILQGDFIAGRSWAERSAALARDRGYWWDEYRARFLAGKAELFAGNVDEADQLNQELIALAGDEVYLRSVMRQDQGMLALRRGDPAGALREFAVALADFRLLGELWTTQSVLDAAAAAMLAGGDVRRAGWLLGAASAIRLRIGAPVPLPDLTWHAPTVAAVRSALGAQAFGATQAVGAAMPLDDAIAVVATAMQEPDQPKRDYLGLTRREREVLRRLVAGDADPRIAAALSISVRTVESHVAHVLAKLGVESRTAAVARAVRLGLD